MKRAGNIVMTGFMEHCDERGPWSMEMTGVMRHGDDSGHGAL